MHFVTFLGQLWFTYSERKNVMPKISDLDELKQISDDDILVINALVNGKSTTLKIKRSVLMNGLAKQTSLDSTNASVSGIANRVTTLEELGFVKKNGVLFVRHRKES